MLRPDAEGVKWRWLRVRNASTCFQSEESLPRGFLQFAAEVDVASGAERNLCAARTHSRPGQPSDAGAVNAYGESTPAAKNALLDMLRDF
jgi:hypothetical protein